MAFNSLKTRLKKFFKYLSLGGLTALLSVVMGLGSFPTVTKIATVNATTPDSPVVQSPTHNPSQLVQEGLQHYQLGQFAAAVQVRQAALHLYRQGKICDNKH